MKPASLILDLDRAYPSAGSQARTLSRCLMAEAHDRQGRCPLRVEKMTLLDKIPASTLLGSFVADAAGMTTSGSVQLRSSVAEAGATGAATADL